MRHWRFGHGLFVIAVLVAAGGLVAGPAAAADELWRALRERLVNELQTDVAETGQRLGRSSLTPAVLDAMRQVPRHEFVPPAQQSYAYENRPLPIGYGQTISQPFIVAVMTELSAVTPGSNALEVGTGSGYQAAVLAACGARVVTVEIIPELARQAQSNLRRLRYDQVEVHTGDGYYGWPERAPFDAILVTAASSHIPPPLIAQLKVGGKMIIPVGGPFMTQQLMLVEKTADGKTTTRQVLPVAFVPLTGGH